MTTVPEALAALDHALTNLMTALESGRPDAVLAAEEPLAVAVRELVAAGPAGVDRAEVRARLRDVRMTLARVQLLGAASASFIQAVVPNASYGAQGRLVSETRPAIASRG
jgi:hypothetical protein